MVSSADVESSRNLAHSARAGFATTAVALGALASFAGPAGVWGVTGVGLCGLLLIAAAAQFWQRRG